VSPRARSLLIGLVAAVGALVAAVGTGALVEATRGDSPRPAPEVELRFGPEDQGGNLEAADVTGDPLPSTTFTTLDGRSASFADYEGTPLVVNFLASWCAPCRDELPGFQAVHDELGPKVAFLGLNPNDRLDDATAFVQRLGVTFDVGRDPNGELFEAFGVAGMPSTFFVSPTGEILGSAVGKLSADGLRSRIDALLLA
jgi:thiol-disulfide isomerase/thioredoxin